jgi:hypothetical protein
MTIPFSRTPKPRSRSASISHVPPGRCLASRSCLLALCTLLFALSTAQAQVAVAAELVDGEARFQMNEQQLVQWVFGNMRGKDYRAQTEQALRVQVEFIATIGTLSPPQRDKLELAGRGDIHRFFDRFETLQRDCPTGMIRQQEWQDIWQKVQPLQMRYQAGLHGRGSLLRKTVRSALDDEQFAAYQAMEAERHRRHYHSLLKATVAMIEQKIPLTIEQRTRLIDLVMEKTEPLGHYGQSYYQYHAILLQMSKIPEQDLKPIFLANEWKVMQGLLQQGRGMEHMIRQMQEASLDD